MYTNREKMLNICELFLFFQQGQETLAAVAALMDSRKKVRA